MNNNTYLNKSEVGSTEICDFTDYQGIGRDPLYKRYESVNSIVKRVIDPQYAHFLATPHYSTDSDTISWYIDEWTETPMRFTSLEEGQKVRYEAIKKATIAHYKKQLENLSGEDLQIMACALRYINDEFIYCCDNKVYLLAWGMTPRSNIHVGIGELIHESSQIIKHKITFDPGEHGSLAIKICRNSMIAQNRQIKAGDLPEIIADKGYKHIGWNPNPVGVRVTSEMTFTAVYEAEPESTTPVVEPAPQAEPEPQFATLTFDAGEYGSIAGENRLRKMVGTRISEGEIPVVTPQKGYQFIGWDWDPTNMLASDDRTITAVYEKRIPWYKRCWLWISDIFSSRFFKWLLWLLLALLLIALVIWLLRGCDGDGNKAVAPIDRIVDANGDTIDNNGIVAPIIIEDGKLPDSPAVTAPIRDGEGNLPPIVREPGTPPVISNRLFLFLEDANSSIDDFANDFKKAYPDEKYKIIGFDRNVKSMVIEIPENERDEIRNTINSKIPNHRFLVLDEEICELNTNWKISQAQTATTGWHLSAVNAPSAWQITSGSDAIKVAVIDDGIDASHPIFEDRIVDAYNVFTQNNQLSAGEGHGTHTAGLAVGSTEFIDKGAAGIAPECMLMPVQVFDNSLCPLSALVSGIMYAIHKDADVINISIGPSFQGMNILPVDVQDQIAQTQFKNTERLWVRVCQIAAEKNAILVFAAGNDDILSYIPPENRTSTAITVGSVDQNLYPTEFTNFGKGTDISAPGKDIYSSFPTGSFKNCDGTSMSAPIVTGAVALMKSLKKDLTVTQAINVLFRTGADVYGNMPPIIQVDLALEAVKNGDFSAPQPRPTRPVPDTETTPDNQIAPPASWSNPGDEAPVIGIGSDPQPGTSPEYGANPQPGDEASPQPGDGAATQPGAGNEPQPGQEQSPEPEAKINLDSIRRLIAIYKQKIIELEGLLPEKSN